MSQVSGFPPVVGSHPRVLILGSMPGTASLDRHQYYAHPRNAYWPIMGALFDAGPTLPYAERLRRLTDCGIALWDVLASCFRPGSLDSNIDGTSLRTNDFATLLAEHAGIGQIYFNGRTAAELFRRRVAPRLAGLGRELDYLTLPSTSPAHAARSFDEKLAAWSVIQDVLRGK